MKPNIKHIEKIPRAMGTGLVALDVIVSADDPTSPKLCTGGTCGNVLLALRFLGWETVPICRLQDNGATRLIRKELRAWGVDTTYVSIEDDGSTPVIVQTIRPNPGGDPTHTFSWRCPYCGTRFPGYKPALAATAETIAVAMPSPEVFFFDRVNRGSIILAWRAAELGAVVVFEPSAVGDPSLFKEAWEIAHIVKYSHMRLTDLPDGIEFGKNMLLQIETLGGDGLRYRTRFRRRASSSWKALAAFKAPIVRDTAGAGDWCSAGLIHRLCVDGITGLQDFSAIDLEVRLKFGQALAAWNCGYVGARGGMESSTVDGCLAEVDRILYGSEGLATANASVRNVGDAGNSWCPSCSETKSPTEKATPKVRRTSA